MSNHKSFELGSIVATPGVLEICPPERMMQCLRSHVAGDWGVCCEDDKKTNSEATVLGLRIHSAYPIDPSLPSKGYGENTLWIITEADRSATTFLLPREY